MPARREALNKSYVETLMYASPSAATEASDLYEKAARAFDPTHTSDDEWDDLQTTRELFMEQVREERDQ